MERFMVANNIYIDSGIQCGVCGKRMGPDKSGSLSNSCAPFYFGLESSNGEIYAVCFDCFGKESVRGLGEAVCVARTERKRDAAHQAAVAAAAKTR